MRTGIFVQHDPDARTGNEERKSGGTCWYNNFRIIHCGYVQHPYTFRFLRRHAFTDTIDIPSRSSRAILPGDPEESASGRTEPTAKTRRHRDSDGTLSLMMGEHATMPIPGTGFSIVRRGAHLWKDFDDERHRPVGPPMGHVHDAPIGSPSFSTFRLPRWNRTRVP